MSRLPKGQVSKRRLDAAIRTLESTMKDESAPTHSRVIAARSLAVMAERQRRQKEAAPEPEPHGEIVILPEHCTAEERERLVAEAHARCSAGGGVIVLPFNGREHEFERNQRALEEARRNQHDPIRLKITFKDGRPPIVVRQSDPLPTFPPGIDPVALHDLARKRLEETAAAGGRMAKHARRHLAKLDARAKKARKSPVPLP
jgi:hypothetical protein